MLDRQLTKLIAQSRARARGDNPLPWAIVGAVAYLLRRSLRQDERIERVTIRDGHEVTIGLRERDG